MSQLSLIQNSGYKYTYFSSPVGQDGQTKYSNTNMGFVKVRGRQEAKEEEEEAAMEEEEEEDRATPPLPTIQCVRSMSVVQGGLVPASPGPGSSKQQTSVSILLNNWQEKRQEAKRSSPPPPPAADKAAELGRVVRLKSGRKVVRMNLRGQDGAVKELLVPAIEGPNGTLKVAIPKNYQVAGQQQQQPQYRAILPKTGSLAVRPDCLSAAGGEKDPLEMEGDVGELAAAKGNGGGGRKGDEEEEEEEAVLVPMLNADLTDVDSIAVDSGDEDVQQVGRGSSREEEEEEEQQDCGETEGMGGRQKEGDTEGRGKDGSGKEGQSPPASGSGPGRANGVVDDDGELLEEDDDEEEDPLAGLGRSSDSLEDDPDTSDEDAGGGAGEAVAPRQAANSLGEADADDKEEEEENLLPDVSDFFQDCPNDDSGVGDTSLT